MSMRMHRIMYIYTNQCYDYIIINIISLIKLNKKESMGHCCGTCICISPFVRFHHNSIRSTKVLPTIIKESEFTSDNLPFARTNIRDFWNLVDKIGSETFTLEQMQKVFTDQETCREWKNLLLWQQKSELSNLLNFFTPMSTEDGQLSMFGVMSLGFLWCAGSIKEKANTLVDVITK